MTYEIKRFDLLTVFKVSFLVYMIVGFLIGLLYSLLIMKIISTFGPFLDNAMFEDMGQIGFFAAITFAFFMAVLLSVIWSIITVIAAGIYNVMAGFVGGLKMELAEIPGLYPPSVPPATMPQNLPPQGGVTGV